VVVVRDTTHVGGQKNYIFGFEGSQVAPTRPSGEVRVKSQSHVTADSQSVSISWCRARFVDA
jgi:hypothetical protein